MVPSDTLYDVIFATFRTRSDGLWWESFSEASSGRKVR